ncbi:MAG: hypothetical protein LBN02_10215 [Oscillospiraceae bacterium]|jgi:hypothetical protein|nr:hypothetical protein [Oscillospiraceae bacterium]
MRKFIILSAPVALVCAILGFFARRDWLRNAFEDVLSGTNRYISVPIRGASQTTLLFALAAVLIVLTIAAAALARSKPAQHTGYVTAFAPFGAVSLVASLLSAALFIAGAVQLALDALNTPAATTATHVSQWVKAILALLTAAAVVGAALSANTLAKSKKTRLSGTAAAGTLVPEVLLTLLLMSVFQARQSNPIILSYAPIALAVALSAFAFYTEAAYAHDRPCPVRAVLTHMTAIFFCGVALADNPDLRWILGGSALILLVNLFKLTVNIANTRVNKAVTAR